jgi:hypothetical protein
MFLLSLAQPASLSTDHVQRLRMHGAIPPLPHTSSWCGAQLSTGTTFILSYIVFELLNAKSVS